MKRPMPAVIDQNDFREAMSRLAGAVSVIATGHSVERRGMTATAVCSVCAEPPSLLTCLHRGTGTSERIRQYGAFSVNVLSEEQLEVAQTFAERTVFGAERFKVGNWVDGALGVPLLADALISFECSVARVHEHGTHVLLIGAIESVRWSVESEPLVFHARQFVGLGRSPLARSA